MLSDMDTQGTVAQDIEGTRPQQPLSVTSKLFQSYLKTVRQLTGAVGASLFLQTDANRDHSAVIYHEGAIPPISEMLTKKTALAFFSGLAKLHNNNEQRSVQLYESIENEGYILRLSMAGFTADQNTAPGPEFATQRRKTDSTDVGPEVDATVWIGLRFGTDSLPTVIKTLQDAQHVSLTGTPGKSSDWLIYTLAMGAYMAWQNYQGSYELLDPVSQLPGRVEFQAYLRNLFDQAGQDQQPLTLLFINPDEFGLINQRFDRDTGDQALAEIADKLVASLRSSDALFRYGGAVFTALIPQTGTAKAAKIAEKLRQTLTGWVINDGIRLTFSIGVAVYQADNEEFQGIDAAAFQGQAEQALNRAKLSGGGCVVTWNPADANMPVASLDRLSGVFTADTEKDYRNMLLLWDTIAVISNGAETVSMAREFVNRVANTLKPNRIGLYTFDQNHQPQLIAASQDKTDASSGRVTGQKLALTDKQQELLDKVKKSKRIERLRYPASRKDAAANKTSYAYVVPLLAREHLLGCLYIEGSEDQLNLDSSDLIFLNALATQVALALDRAELVEQWKLERERESRKLREEVRELRQVVQSARIVYRSAQMESILETIRTVAPTDVTILITGESGTGKEMLALAVHEYSDRQKKPFITVDCGSISQNLIEAELFGHVKGAFTGAQRASEGRIVQAEGGMLFLDEVGELPLDVQAKLLRFVQEKEINPVGAKRSRRVDVRIVAATNRDLAKEVAMGRFRGDLYYRLQVVTVTSPALRNRSEDILPLAQHFLEKFALQYQKGIRRFSSDAERALLEYTWPGNVRELQNCILRAVVLSATEMIDRRHLQFVTESIAEERQQLQATPGVSNDLIHQLQPAGGVMPLDRVQQQSQSRNPPEDSRNPWEQLRDSLEQQLVEVFESSSGVPVPLGRWLTEDLVLTADATEKGVARRAAVILGLAETTFRRQFEKAKRAEQAGLLARSAAWADLQPVLKHLINSSDDGTEQNIVDKARLTLLNEVYSRVSGDCSLGAAFMGVTVPTYRRWIESLQNEQQLS